MIQDSYSLDQFKLAVLSDIELLGQELEDELRSRRAYQLNKV